jgi:cellulose synthase/poly-beta-1,6-N-acetylglucosamine synthase-like glycosyltransferase/peptidoglycan/xylan/chitin deacetylase (PgdA/CDA1 family)/spore germination protein YaaH
MAFFAGDENGLNSLKENLNEIDVLLPVWLGLDEEKLELKSASPENMKAITDITKERAVAIKLMPVFSNYDNKIGNWNSQSIERLLNSEEIIQNKIIDQLKNYSLENKLYGISLDFEGVTSANQEKYIKFIQNLKNIFGQNHLALSINIPINSKDYDFAEYAKVTDFVIVRAYDEHWLSGEPGTIASQRWFEEKIFEISNKIPKNKLVIGFGTFAYDWADGEKNAEIISYSQAVQLAKDSGTKISFDNPNLNSNFEYYDSDNKLHKVYLLDAVSAFNEMQYASKLQPKGYAIWQLGFEDSSIWKVLSNEKVEDRLSGIETVPALTSIDHQGTGDVLKIKEVPEEGKRKVTFDGKINLITNVEYLKSPSGFVIARTGDKSPKKVVSFTFDDGPDQTYTPEILEILKSNNIKATFFVVGSEAVKYPDLLKRIVEEGHLIGNHTYTHADISKITKNQLKIELNSTELLIESILNIKSIIFRPPYDADINPKTILQASPLKQVTEAGYITIGFNIDPKDWDLPGVDMIVAETVKQAKASHGGIVLLHDGGGDRKQTIEALPKIISALRVEGFQFVPLNEIIGVDSVKINPKIGNADYLNVFINNLFVYSLKFLLYFLQALILLGLLIGIFRFFPIALMAIIHSRRTRNRRYKDSYNPKVSVIIAAYNEEKVIVETINNILLSDYDKDKLEIIVVNDGSNDKTWEVLKKNFANTPYVKIFNKRNGGKSTAVNYGIMKSVGEIMVSIDADTLVAPKTIKALVRHFSDPKVGAVAGNAKVGNRENVLTRFQALEYITSQNLDKRAFDFLNAITVVPGAIGAWRMKLIKKLGGLNDNTLAEDSDLTLNIIKEGYIVHFEEEGLAYTEAPTTLKDLAAQRFRWAFGTLQVLAKNKVIIGNPRYKWLGIVGLPNVIFFQIFSPLITPMVDLALGLQIILFIIQVNYNLDLLPLQQFGALFVYSIIFNILDFTSCLIAFSLEKRENWKLLLWLLPQRIFYRVFLNWICIKSLISALKGCPIGWNKLNREGYLKNSTIGKIVYD